MKHYAAALVPLIVLIAPALYAQSPQPCDGKASYAECEVTRVNVRRLCNFVSGKSLEDPDEVFQFAAETALWEMSGAKLNVDSPEQATRKIQRMWDRHKSGLTCNTTRMFGNVLQIAVNSAFPEFIEMLEWKYGLDMNFIDPSTGRTVLDFVQSEIRRLEDSGLGESAHARTLRGYYKSFREWLKLKHASEIR